MYVWTCLHFDSPDCFFCCKKPETIHISFMNANLLLLRGHEHLNVQTGDDVDLTKFDMVFFVPSFIFIDLDFKTKTRMCVG